MEEEDGGDESDSENDDDVRVTVRIEFSFYCSGGVFIYLFRVGGQKQNEVMEKRSTEKKKNMVGDQPAVFLLRSVSRSIDCHCYRAIQGRAVQCIPTLHVSSLCDDH